VGIYKSNNLVGSVGFDSFTYYPEAGDNPRAVYNKLMLGSLVSWDNEYTPVKKSDTLNTATCKISRTQMEPGMAAASSPIKYSQGILAHDYDLLVYIGIEIEEGVLSKEELDVLVDSIVLDGSAAETSSQPDPAMPNPSENTALPSTTNPDLAEVFDKLKNQPETLSVGCDITDNAGGSLVLSDGERLMRKISEAVSQHTFEELSLDSQPPYSRYVRVSGPDNGWTLTFLEQHDYEDPSASENVFLSLMKDGYPEPSFFFLDRAVFDELYTEAKNMVYMPEPQKAEFIEPLQALIEDYKHGAIVNNELEPRFGDFPAGEPVPVIETVDDFDVERGNDMVNYHVVIPIGDGSKWEMVVGMNYMYPQAHLPQVPEWAATYVSFRPVG
jgi:hypothetical protein